MFEQIKDKKNFLPILAAVAGFYGLSYVESFAAKNVMTNSYSSICIFAVLIWLLRSVYTDISQISDIKLRRKRILYAYATAAFFSLTLIMGYQLKKNGMTECGVKGKGLILLRSMLLAFSQLPFTNIIYKWMERSFSCVQTDEWNYKYGRRMLGCFWAFVFLCWIPVFLAYYPAIMSYDFHRQSWEAMKGFIWFNSYQPLIHTLLIWAAFQIGNLFGSLQVGMACYSIFQMFVFSFACAYSCRLLYRLTKRKGLSIVLALFYALFPYNSVLAVEVTKDVMFSAFFLLFVCLFIEKTVLKEKENSVLHDVLWVLTGIMMALFRNNALYAMAVFVVIYFCAAEKGKRLRIFVLGMCLVLGGKGALEGLQLALHAGRGSQVEMFSVPIQQFARVGYYHGDTLSEETYELINTYVPEEYWNSYNPPISDSVKAWIGAVVFDETWKGHYDELFSAWLKVGLQYPNEYIDAFLLLTSGYWFIDDVSYAEVLGYGSEGRMGALYTYNSTVSEVIPEGIEHETKFAWLEDRLENIVSANCYYDWPVISNLFKPAFYCWALLLAVLMCFYRKDWKSLLVASFLVIYLATMFLGPVVQVRYILPIMITVPLIFGVLVSRKQI